MSSLDKKILFSSEEKKLLLILKLVIFYYHTLDENEIQILNTTVQNLDAKEEFEWVKNFINNNVSTGFEKAKEFLKKFDNLDIEKKILILNDVWESANKKGYITEMEATALLKLAKDWKIEKELLALVRKKWQ
jgi:hypothetical protein